MKRLLTALALIGFAGCGNASPGSQADPTPAEPTAKLSDKIQIDQIAIYQGVKVTLVDEAAVIAQKKINAPVIPGRPALVRVHAKPLEYRLKLKATAELHVHVDGRPDVVVKDAGKSVVTLDDSALSSTFNFELGADDIAPGATLDVTVHDDAAPDDTIQFPDDGTKLPMNVGPLAPTLRVKFVPVKYDADGSGRVPDLSDKTLEDYKSTLYRLYPVSRVEVAVRDPLRWPMKVTPDGDGWDDLLSAIIKTRTQDRVEDDLYYIAVFDPTDSAGEWCADGGCILGVAPQAMLRDVTLRVAMITGFSHNEDTLAQELGHAMGRAHAPCGGASAVDPNWPYGRANIGVWGYDIVDKTLIDPEDRVFDFMGYCHPTWVSDYTVAGLYDRMVKVDQTKRPPGDPVGGAGGSAKASSSSQMVQISRVLPDGTRRSVARVPASDVDLASGTVRSIAGLPGTLRIDPAN